MTVGAYKELGTGTQQPAAGQAVLAEPQRAGLAVHLGDRGPGRLRVAGHPQVAAGMPDHRDAASGTGPAAIPQRLRNTRIPASNRRLTASRPLRDGKGLAAKFPEYTPAEEPGGYCLVAVSRFRTEPQR
jgi:hypothetical protein